MDQKLKNESKNTGLASLLPGKSTPRGQTPTDQKPRRTIYALASEKQNIIEIQRSLNKERMNQSKACEHIGGLHRLDQKRKEIRDQLLKQKEEKALTETYSFKPTIDKGSKRMMSKSRLDLIQRNQEWLKQKEDKLQHQKETRKKMEAQKEYQSMVSRPEYPRAKIDVASKVKALLDKSISKYDMNLSEFKARSYSPMAPKIPTSHRSYILNTRKISRDQFVYH